MTEKVIYTAEDGKEFTNKEECLQYETEKMLKDLHFYDDNRNPIPIPVDDFDRLFKMVYYVQAESIEALDKLNELCDNYGYDPIPYEDLRANYDDLFCYSDAEEIWHSLRNDLKELKELADFFQVSLEYEY